MRPRPLPTTERLDHTADVVPGATVALQPVDAHGVTRGGLSTATLRRLMLAGRSPEPRPLDVRALPLQRWNPAAAAATGTHTDERADA
jgi:hypothetical protein